MQTVRQHKKRTSKQMDEPNMFSGLVYCADCGKPLVLHRASTMKKTAYNFKCYTFGKRGKDTCTPHHIREMDLMKIVLDDIRRVTHSARTQERQFAQYINQKNSVELRREMNVLQKEPSCCYQAGQPRDGPAEFDADGQVPPAAAAESRGAKRPRG